jgi:hypothetical protein
MMKRQVKNRPHFMGVSPLRVGGYYGPRGELERDLIAKLKELREVWREMTRAERNSDHGQLVYRAIESREAELYRLRDKRFIPQGGRRLSS